MADVEIEDNGTIIGLIPVTPKGYEWLDENVSGGVPPNENVIWADHRMAGNIIEGMIDDGLSVE